MEKVIKKTPEGWYTFLSKNNIRGPLTLTNNRLTIGDDDYSILIQDIFDVEITTRFANVPKIQIDCIDGPIFMEFVRLSASHSANLFLGDTGWAFSELASYTSYWASLLTMTVFLHGNADEARARWEEIRVEEQSNRAYCHRCGEYMTVQMDDLQVWQILCPKCGRKGMTSLSPEDAREKSG